MFRERSLEQNDTKVALRVSAGWFAGAFAVGCAVVGVGDRVLALVFAWVIPLSSLRVGFGFAALSGIALMAVRLGAPAVPAHNALLVAVVLWRAYRRFEDADAEIHLTHLVPTSWIRAHAGILRKVCSAGGVVALAAALARGTSVLSLAAVASLLFLERRALPAASRQRAAAFKSVAANAALFLVFGVASLCALEWGVRHFTLVSQGDFYLVPDPVTDFTLGRNAYTKAYIMQNATAPTSVELTTSSQGLREDWLGPKGESEFRIVMLGDSYTMGWGLAQCDTYERQLNELLSQRVHGRTIRVINAGVGGFAPWQERVFLRERCLPLQPDLVILQIYPENDVPDTALHNGEYLRAVSLRDVRNTRMFRRYDCFPYRLEYWLRNHWYTYRYFIYAVWKGPLVAESMLRCRLFPEQAVDTLPGTSDRPEHMEPSLKESYPVLDRAYAAMESDILGIQQDCRAQGIDLFAFALPCPFAVNEDSWRSVADTGQYVRFNDVIRAEAQFRRDGVPYVPMLNAVLARHKAENVFLPDGHFNAVGARVVAQALDDYLATSYFPGRGVLASASGK